MNNSINLNPDRILRGQRTNSLCVLISLWLSHLNCQHVRAIKAAQKQKYPVKAPHGAEQHELWDTRPPFLNQPFLWRPEKGGVWFSVKVKRPTFESADGWMMEIQKRCVMKGCGRVSGELELIPQHFTRWQIDGQRRTTATTEGIFFSLSVAAEITVMAQGFKPATDNVPLWNLIQPYGAFRRSAPLCPFSSQIKWLHSRFCLFLHKGGGNSEVNSTSCTLDWLVPEQPDDSLGGGGENSYGLPLHINRSPECNSAGNAHQTPTWRRGSWNLQLAGRQEDRFASQ